MSCVCVLTTQTERKRRFPLYTLVFFHGIPRYSTGDLTLSPFYKPAFLRLFFSLNELLLLLSLLSILCNVLLRGSGNELSLSGSLWSPWSLVSGLTFPQGKDLVPCGDGGSWLVGREKEFVRTRLEGGYGHGHGRLGVLSCLVPPPPHPTPTTFLLSTPLPLFFFHGYTHYISRNIYIYVKVRLRVVQRIPPDHLTYRSGSYKKGLRTHCSLGEGSTLNYISSPSYKIYTYTYKLP